MQKFIQELSPKKRKPDPWRRRTDCFDATYMTRYMRLDDCYCKTNTTIVDCDNISIDSE